MKNNQNNENGYALLIVLGLIVLLTLLGTSLQALTASGLKKNNNREEITVAQDLSVKGIEFFQTELNEHFKQEIGSGLTILEFEGMLKDTLEESSTSNYLCPKTIEITGELGLTKVCIEKSMPYSNKEVDKLKRIITVKSEGINNNGNQSKISYAQIVVGADSIPEQLNYAISTNADSDGKGGNLFLFGGIDVTGDIKSDGNIYLNERAFSGWLYDPNWASLSNSTYAKLTAAEGNSYPKIIINSEKAIYKMDGTIGSYRGGRQNSIIQDEENSPFGKFLISPSFENDNNTLNKEYKANAITTKEQEEIQKLFKDYTLNEKNKPRVIVQEVVKDTIDINSVVNNNGKITKGDPITNNRGNIIGYSDDFTIRGRGDQNSNTSFGEADAKYYIEGDLLIGRYAGESTLENDEDKYYNITLQGEYYVKGAIDIRGAKLKGNAKFYSMKDINIVSSTVSGYDSGTNFFFANDFINISNISSGSDIDKPSIIDGFFYSKGHLLMYGYGSNIKINGGISANRIILTALRGEANVGDKTSESRLRVFYDLSMIEKFLQNRDENTVKITQPAEPKILEMSLKPFN